MRCCVLKRTSSCKGQGNGGDDALLGRAQRARLRLGLTSAISKTSRSTTQPDLHIAQYRTPWISSCSKSAGWAVVEERRESQPGRHQHREATRQRAPKADPCTMDGRGGPAIDDALADQGETIQISALALLKVGSGERLRLTLSVPVTDCILDPLLKQMLKHGRAGVPLEVMVSSSHPLCRSSWLQPSCPILSDQTR